MAVFRNFKNQSHSFMTIFSNLVKQGVTSHSKIKTLRYFRMKSSALARNTTHGRKKQIWTCAELKSLQKCLMKARLNFHKLQNL